MTWRDSLKTFDYFLNLFLLHWQRSWTVYAQNVFYKSYTQFLKLITKKRIFESPFLYLSKHISAQSESTDTDLHSFMDIKNPFNFDRDLVKIS
jgi:hypothetical protein